MISTFSPLTWGAIERIRLWKLLDPWPATEWADAGAAVTTNTARPITTVATVRRIAVILACGLVLAVATASRAAAHPLPTNSRVPVGRPGTVTIGIPSEATVAMTGVDFNIPANYRIIKPIPPPGWRVSVNARQMRFTHGNVAPGSFAVFSFRGQASKRGPLKFDLTIRSANGHSQLWDGVPGKDAFPAPVVYAGVPPPTSPANGRRSLLQLAGWALVVLGGAAAVWRVAARRRKGPSGLEPADEVGAGTSHP
jgi:hypothetical protein